MIRTRIRLAEQQAEALRRPAAERGASISALAREAVDRVVGGSDLGAERRRALCAGYASGAGGASDERCRDNMLT